MIQREAWYREADERSLEGLWALFQRGDHSTAPALHREMVRSGQVQDTRRLWSVLSHLPWREVTPYEMEVERATPPESWPRSGGPFEYESPEADGRLWCVLRIFLPQEFWGTFQRFFQESRE